MRLLKSGLAAIVGAFMLNATGAIAQDYPELSLRAASFVPATDPQSVAEIWWAEEINKRSGGKIKITQLWAGAGGAHAELPDLVASGAIDIASFVPGNFPSKFPLYSAPNSLPTSFKSREQILRVMAGFKTLDSVKAEFARNNVWPLFHHVLLPYRVICNVPVAKLDDFKGLRIRSFGAYQPLLWESLGATGVVAESREIYEGLQRNRFDCAMYAEDGIVTSKLYEVAKQLSTVDFGPISGWSVFINKDVWEGFPPEVRTLFEQVSDEAKQHAFDIMTERDKKAPSILAENGVTRIEFTEQAKLAEVVPDFIQIWVDTLTGNGLGEEVKEPAALWRAEIAKP